MPRAAITKIEASRHRSRKGLGAAIGLLTGLGTAALIVHAARGDCERSPQEEFLSRCLLQGVGATLAGIVIVPAGTLIGLAAAPGERWQVSTTDRVRVAVAPVHGGGVRAALAIRF